MEAALKEIYADEVHWAHTQTFDTLVDLLKIECNAGYVKKRIDPKTNRYELYNYTPRCITDNKGWTPARLVSRGLVLDPVEKKIVATPFPKFFNLGEAPLCDPKEFVSVTAKEDGSLGILWYDPILSQWRMHTRGSFDSTQAMWGEKWVQDHMDEIGGTLTRGSTYMFEIIYPENRIVISYNWTGLVLLGIVGHDGWDIPVDHQTRHYWGNFSCIRVVDEHIKELDTFDKLRERMASRDHPNIEGYVVRCDNGLRFKGNWTHISNLTPTGLLQSLRTSTSSSIDEHWNALSVLMNIDEETRDDFDKLAAECSRQWSSAVKSAHDVYVACKHLSNKNIGLQVKTGLFPFPYEQTRVLFMMRKDPEIEQYADSEDKLSGYLFTVEKLRRALLSSEN